MREGALCTNFHTVCCSVIACALPCPARGEGGEGVEGGEGREGRQGPARMRGSGDRVFFVGGVCVAFCWVGVPPYRWIDFWPRFDKEL